MDNSSEKSLETNLNIPHFSIDFKAITKQFEQAVKDGRHFLYEYEVYNLLQRSGAETPPRAVPLFKGKRHSDKDLSAVAGEKVVLKILSPTIVHKTEVDGVRVVENSPEKIRSTWRRMMYEVPRNCAAWLDRHPGLEPPAYRGLAAEALFSAIARDIQGVLMVQYMPPDSEAFGNELIVGARRTREFGMVISAGLGGTDTELYAERFRKGQAIVAASTEMIDGRTFFEMFRHTISYRKLAGLTRGQRRIVTDEQLVECFSSFVAMANFFSPTNPNAPFVIDELEINPFAFTDFLMVPLDGMCRFSRPVALSAARPVEKIGRLLRPQSIGIIGVSAGRINFGRTILRNVLAGGFEPAGVTVIKSGVDEIDGVRCVPELASLQKTLDLLVVAVDAAGVPDLIEEVIDRNAAETVMLIPGGLGEKKGSEARARALSEKIALAHATPEGGPVILGGNCLGVVSHPGAYDTLFIPEAKLPKRRGSHKRTAAFVSQSGAFMITRLSKRPYLDPAYVISIGNQTDLTLGDMLGYLKNLMEIDTIAIYAEGFKELDGLAFAIAVRQAVLRGKDVIFYKAGRTPEGKSATSGHTASLAGDYMICESCMRQAGALVATSFTQFESLLMLSTRLHGTRINGNRLAAVSGAGFEAVGMADSIQADDYHMQMAAFSDNTTRRIEKILMDHQLHSLVDIRNPLDINPTANDTVHALVVEALVDDPDVDAVVVGLDPLSPATYTLAEGEPRYDMHAEDGAVTLMTRIMAVKKKPVVGVVDGGRQYDALVDALETAGLPVFRSSDIAVASLAMYMEGRLRAERIRLRNGLDMDADGAVPDGISVPQAIGDDNPAHPSI
jgi:acyl-CoA synthetase (NDP forming)